MNVTDTQEDIKLLNSNITELHEEIKLLNPISVNATKFQEDINELTNHTNALILQQTQLSLAVSL
jgi:hypothetical protein